MLVKRTGAREQQPKGESRDGSRGEWTGAPFETRVGGVLMSCMAVVI